MPLPTRTVTGLYTNGLTGAVHTGEVELTPYPSVWHDTTGAEIRVGGGPVTLVDGAFSAALVPIDAAGVDPADGRLWQITERLTGQPARSRYFALTSGDLTPVDVTELVVAEPGALTYLPAVGPAGPQGETGPQGPAGGSIATAVARITDDNLGGLPAAPAWAIVQTSAGTPLQCSIAAVAGDRIKVFGDFMRSGSHFLDWALLSNTGAIALYAGSETSSPLPEGAPSMYPSLSFSYVAAAEMFTVAAGHVSAGSVTVALAHQGAGAGVVYAHTTYPWKLRLENIGAEPA